MAVIVITSHGTLGDNLPLIALGQELKLRNHQVCMVISEPMHPYAYKAGLEAFSNGRDPVGQQEAQKNPQAWNHLSHKNDLAYKEFCDTFWLHLIQGLPCLLEICNRVDLLISTPQQNSIAAITHEKLSVPWISVSVTPSLHCIELKKKKKTPNSDDELLVKQLHQIVEEIRQSIDLPPLSCEDLEQYHHCDRLILASSPHFSRPTKAYSHAIQTGFWFYKDPDWNTWQPDVKLRAFMEQDSKPLVLSFSSQPLEDARSVVEVHVRAAAKLGRPILIQHGWADFNEEHLPKDCDRSQVMFAGFMPQDWLFSRAAALIHHGGIGTTARALRNGCPMLVEPYGNDQFFNAKQIVFHGVGAAMHPMRLQVDEVARVLRNKVLTPDYKQRAEVFGTKLKEDNGLKTACNLIENLL